MTSVSPISWRRAGRASARQKAPCDRMPLEALAASPHWRSVAGLTRELPLESRAAERDSALSLVFEVDAQITGAVALQSGRLEPALGPHPWTQLPGAPRLARPSAPPSETLLVDGLGWHEQRSDPERVRTWLESGLTERCLQLGARRVVVPLPLDVASHPQLGDLEPATYLQQVHYRGVASPDLEPFFDRNFELRGWFEPGATADVDCCALLVWENGRM